MEKKQDTITEINNEQKELIQDMIEKIMKKYVENEQKKMDVLFEKLDNTQKDADQARDLVRNLIWFLRKVDQEKIDAFMEEQAKKNQEE